MTFTIKCTLSRYGWTAETEGFPINGDETRVSGAYLFDVLDRLKAAIGDRALNYVLAPKEARDE